MTLEELYGRIGGSYQDGLDHLRSEKLIGKMILMFPGDTSCPRIISAWDDGELETGFRAAHEAKGVCANLYLTRLALLTSSICEELRPAPHKEIDRERTASLIDELRSTYDHTLQEIEAYRQQL